MSLLSQPRCCGNENGRGVARFVIFGCKVEARAVVVARPTSEVTGRAGKVPLFGCITRTCRPLFSPLLVVPPSILSCVSWERKEAPVSLDRQSHLIGSLLEVLFVFRNRRLRHNWNPRGSVFSQILECARRDRSYWYVVLGIEYG